MTVALDPGPLATVTPECCERPDRSAHPVRLGSTQGLGLHPLMPRGRW